MLREGYGNDPDVPLAVVVMPSEDPNQASADEVAAQDRALVRARRRFPLEAAVFVGVSMTTAFNLGCFFKLAEQINRLSAEANALPALSGTPQGDSLTSQ